MEKGKRLEVVQRGGEKEWKGESQMMSGNSMVS